MEEVTPEQMQKLKVLEKAANKQIAKVLFRLFAMILFFAIATILVGIYFVPGSHGFIVLGNAIGGIFVLVDAIEGAEIVVREFKEQEKSILKKDL